MADLDQAIVGLLRELIDGAAGVGSVLHSRDAGMLASLDALTARDASARPGGRSSVAAHVDHLLYELELLNRWAAGDDPGADAGDPMAWTRHDVS